jgi:hypothetical protein
MIIFVIIIFIIILLGIFCFSNGGIGLFVESLENFDGVSVSGAVDLTVAV